MQGLRILYGTQTGTAQEVAEAFASLAAHSGARGTTVGPADSVPVEEWPSLSTILLFCSTTGQGEAPETMRRSWETLMSTEAPRLDGLSFAVFGLGDSSYAKYNYVAKLLHNRLKQLGAHPLVHRGLGDDMDANGYLDGLRLWLAQVASALKLPLQESPTLLWCGPAALKYQVVYPSNVEDEQGTACHQPVDLTKLRVARNDRITSPDHFQDVHRVDFLRPDVGFSFVCGDSLAVTPRSSLELSRVLATRCGWKLDDVVVVVSAVETSGVAFHKEPFCGRAMPLQELLIQFFDLDACVSRSFLHMLSGNAKDPEERERLLELISVHNTDDFLRYCYREKRNAAEVLSDFPSCQPSLDMVLSYLRPMRPRYFSIASSPSGDRDVLTLLVARLSFVTPYQRRRVGVCSSMLCDAAVGDTVSCALHEGNRIILPVESPFPLFVVGPGTGYAPIRGLLREAAFLGWRNKIHFFFGCRNPCKDYLCKADVEELRSTSTLVLEVHVAFSRYETPKRYVQHLMVRPDVAPQLVSDGLAAVGETGDEREPLIYICGNSKQMPRDVENALISVLATYCCDGDEGAATERLKRSRAVGRYITDTWSV